MEYIIFILCITTVILIYSNIVLVIQFRRFKKSFPEEIINVKKECKRTIREMELKRRSEEACKSYPIKKRFIYSRIKRIVREIIEKFRKEED